jgi:hypothetical protein
VTNSELLLIVACVLFAVAGVYRITVKAFDTALVAFGLALTALAFVVAAVATVEGGSIGEVELCETVQETDGRMVTLSVCVRRHVREFTPDKEIPE